MFRKFHTRVEPVGRVAKMNWLNYDMGMKIHAICDTKNAILKYFSLDMWKFTQIWAFFFLPSLRPYDVKKLDFLLID